MSTTLVIVGILGSVALSNLFDDLVVQQRVYIDEVASALSHARRVAIATECQVQVTIAPATYIANLRANPATCATGPGAWITPVLRGDGTALQGTAPEDVLVAPAAVVIFERDGSIAAVPPNLIAGPFTLSFDGTSGIVGVTP